ncbi:formate dehydrogenase alpha subunit [Haladaptatus paucihalophilus DX253]|uniref:Formate dehydrogenase alpha subunit n=1 Tax=Haladaptatus paucihalophilus DX253 TaxID=797209 RepID=E7QR60_HALPU|nr:molybdopterin-dependent oxidoreductase [Haladaptatus paucihalophilus]EFW92968.1 formate dehydrogenase alpha subunit [Haladaptatus paucihalophilus DX253]SHL17947.1 formate dehydrogenase major subunit [Haladaptatus paucihalophilus DX253]
MGENSRERTGGGSEQTGGGGERTIERDAKSICPFCGVGCGVRPAKTGTSGKSARGRGWHAPVNRRGELCPKGVAAYEVVGHDERLTEPQVRRDEELVSVSWDEAFSRIETEFARIVDEHGPDALGFFSSSGCTNEEDYLLQKIARTLGTNNVDNCARLCHSSTVAAMASRFGAGAMTNTLSDLGDADCFLICGSNPAEQHPIIFSSYLAPAAKEGTTVIQIDPRTNRTSAIADHHLPVKPGYDIPLLNAMCAVIFEEGLEDEGFLRERVSEVTAFREFIADVDVSACAELAGIAEDDLREAARVYATVDRAAAFTGMGMSQHRYGTTNVHALLNLSLVTGNIGKRGAGVNPLRGKNNVQGASDVGCLPDVLPGYRSVTDEDARTAIGDVWGVEPPSKPGLTEVEMTHEFGDGIRGAFVFGENIAATEPNASRTARELDSLDCLVVQDIFPTRTVEHADVVLPASSWAEKEGTVTNTDRQVQRMRPVASPPGNARADLDVLRELGRRLMRPTGNEEATENEASEGTFDYDGAAAVFEELRRVTPQYAGMRYAEIGEGSQRWPLPEGASEGTGVLHRETFANGHRRVPLVPVELVEPDDEDELVLTTGRVIEHFNSGVVTRRSDVLTRLRSTDAMQIHPDDARKRGIEDGETVVVESEHGRVEASATVTPSIRSGVVFLTFHFAEPLVNRLTGDELDPESKIPTYKHVPVTVTKEVSGASND